MKLIIDIPELFYNNSKKRVSSGIDLPIDKYVANGTPYTERPQGEFNLEDFKRFVEGKIDMQDLYLPEHLFMLLDEYLDMRGKEE